jgi:hypothetical protein
LWKRAGPVARPTSRPQAFTAVVIGLIVSATAVAQDKLFTKAIDETRARYLLTSYPEGVPKPGWHPLKIGARGRGDVIARPGYFKVAQD